VTYKLATLTFKTLSSDEPSYLRSLLITHQPARNLRSSTLNLLTVTSPRTNLSSRAFRHSATAIWNNLPAVIRRANSLHVFKRRLKTHPLQLLSTLNSSHCGHLSLRLVPCTTYGFILYCILLIGLRHACNGACGSRCVRYHFRLITS